MSTREQWELRRKRLRGLDLRKIIGIQKMRAALALIQPRPSHSELL